MFEQKQTPSLSPKPPDYFWENSNFIIKNTLWQKGKNKIRRMILLHFSMVQMICSSALVEIKHIRLDYAVHAVLPLLLFLVLTRIGDCWIIEKSYGLCVFDI